MVKKVKEVKVTIEGNRSSLGEGRTYGLGFAFCKPTEDGYVTVQPPSTCKDYLNDVLAIERFFPKGRIDIYGLKYTKAQGVFDKKNISYLFVQPLPVNSGSVPAYYNYEKDRKEFPSKIDNILQVVRTFEEKMEFKSETQVLPTDQDGGFLFRVPEEWTSSTYMLSLYALMIRAAAHVRISDPLGAFLGAPALDSSMVATVRTKIDYMLKTKKLPAFNPSNYGNPAMATAVSSSIHNAGIMAWNPATDPNTTYLGKDPITDEAIIKA